jgi:hypothetical protein
MIFQLPLLLLVLFGIGFELSEQATESGAKLGVIGKLREDATYLAMEVNEIAFCFVLVALVVRLVRRGWP